LRNLFLRRLKSGRLTPVVGEFRLALEACVRTPEGLICDLAPVRDGLGYMAAPAEKAGRLSPQDDLRVQTLEMLSPATAKPLPLPGEVPVRVNGTGWIRLPCVRSWQRTSWEKNPGVRSVNCFNDLAPARGYDRWFVPSRVVVKPGTPRIGLLPVSGRAVEPVEMNDAERASFLREAAALKGVTPDRGELLAVFRNVPIEIVSRLSFNKESRTIVYRLTFNPTLRRTRVHDIAAVLDSASGEIHLVPHRARYRTVFLN
jgi:hypothetical protein